MLAVSLQPGTEKAIHLTAQCMRQQGYPKSSIELMLMFLNDHRSAAIHQLPKHTYLIRMKVSSKSRVTDLSKSGGDLNQCECNQPYAIFYILNVFPSILKQPLRGKTWNNVDRV